MRPNYEQMKAYAFASALVPDGYAGKMANVLLCYYDGKVYNLADSGYHWSGIVAYSVDNAINKCKQSLQYSNFELVSV